jgi:hypothetical protein
MDMLLIAQKNYQDFLDAKSELKKTYKNIKTNPKLLRKNDLPKKRPIKETLQSVIKKYNHLTDEEKENTRETFYPIQSDDYGFR